RTCERVYVGYARVSGELSVSQWIDVFEQCLALGALTFGIVGKEPTLKWQKSVEVMQWLAEKRQLETRLRFGLVTNATRLDKKKATDLNHLRPDYIDVSLDGVGAAHDAIRGEGSYQRTMDNVAALPHSLKDQVFISFTANEKNVDSLPELVKEITEIGLRNLLVSPYVQRENRALTTPDTLLSTDDRLIQMCLDLVEGRLIDFAHLDNFNFYVKNDFSTRRSLMLSLADIGVIDFNNLWTDDYGVIFTPYQFGTNQVLFNYLPFDTTFRKAIRFSHDGFIGNCYDMFFPDYTKRVVGNVRDTRLSTLYSNLEREHRASNLQSESNFTLDYQFQSYAVNRRERTKIGF
ncbi:MAG: radical SAM protein, partial [Candidatus Thiodiazotropha taylori]